LSLSACSPPPHNPNAWSDIITHCLTFVVGDKCQRVVCMLSIVRMEFTTEHQPTVVLQHCGDDYAVVSWSVWYRLLCIMRALPDARQLFSVVSSTSSVHAINLVYVQSQSFILGFQPVHLISVSSSFTPSFAAEIQRTLLHLHIPYVSLWQTALNHPDQTPLCSLRRALPYVQTCAPRSLGSLFQQQSS